MQVIDAHGAYSGHGFGTMTLKEDVRADLAADPLAERAHRFAGAGMGFLSAP